MSEEANTEVLEDVKQEKGHGSFLGQTGRLAAFVVGTLILCSAAAKILEGTSIAHMAVLIVGAIFLYITFKSSYFSKISKVIGLPLVTLSTVMILSVVGQVPSTGQVDETVVTTEQENAEVIEQQEQVQPKPELTPNKAQLDVSSFADVTWGCEGQSGSFQGGAVSLLIGKDGHHLFVLGQNSLAGPYDVDGSRLRLHVTSVKMDGQGAQNIPLKKKSHRS